MSDGKMKLDSAVSLEERNEQLELQNSGLIARFQKYDFLIAKVEGMEKSFRLQEAAQSEMMRELQMMREKLLDDEKRFLQFQNDVKDFQLESSKAAKYAYENIVLLKEDINKLELSISNAVNSINEATISKKEFYSCHDHSNQKIIDCQVKTQQHSDKFEATNNALSDLKNKLAEKQQYFDAIFQDINALKTNFSDMDIFLSSFTNSNMEKQLSFENLIKQFVQKKCDEIVAKIPLAAPPQKDVSQEILHKLDLVSLDGSNAVLKANNSEKKIMVLEKKIENLSLELKKIELEK